MRFAFVLLALLADVAAAAPFIVDTTSDVGLTACTDAANDCSLRGALSRANGTAVEHLVHFNIPMTDGGCVAATGVCTIRPATALPDINPNANGLVTIDGLTQPGASANTNTPAQGGINAQLKIVLSGTACGGGSGCSNGLSFVRHGTVSGLVINGFGGGTAVSFSQAGNGGVVEGCYIGTDVSGMIAVPNRLGVIAGGNPFGGGFSSNVRVGGSLPRQRNVISGQTSDGINAGGANFQILGNLIGTNAAGTAALGNATGMRLSGGVGFFQIVGGADASSRNVISGNGRGVVIAGAGPTNGTRVIGNFIGTDVTGTLPLGNGNLGIELSTGVNGVQPPLVGGTLAGEGNVIAFNGTQGVATRNTRGQVIGNLIFRNGQLGISSRTGDNGTNGGRLPNDPGDPDNPANNGQNFPDISAYALSGGNVNLSYRVDSTTANSAYPLRVEFFKADGDEGRDLIGFDSYLAAEAQTVKAISLPIPSGLTLGADDVIVGTATDAQGNTSEFSFSLVQSLSIIDDTPDPSIAGLPYSVTVRAESTGTPFKPNGSVVISDGRGSACVATLAPTVTANRSEGSCELVSAGAAGGIFLTASYSTFASAFGTSIGASIANASAPHQIGAGAVAIEAADGGNQYTRVSTPFATPLRVRVLAAGGAPFAGASVRFAAPTGGASASLSATTVVSDANGIAEVLATANAVAGRYSITASLGGLTQGFTLNNDSLLGSRCTGARSSVLGFRDDFAGSAIDPARWTVDANDGSVTVAAGEATVNAGNVVGFPYVTASAGPLPASGAFSLRWIATYTSTSAVYGNNSLVASTGLAPDGGTAGSVIFHAYAGQYPSGYIADARISATDAGPAAFISNPPALVRREVEFCWLQGRDELWVDGVRVENPVRDPILARPDALWFGNFDRGVLPGEHPDFRLDLVEVRALEVGFGTDLQIVSNTPNPSTPGQSVLVSVALNPEAGAPTAPSGTVPVTASTGESCSIVLPATSCSLSFATLGERIIEASYAGDAVFRSSKAAQRSHRVQEAPTLRIADAAIAEGDSGTTALRFTVSLDNPTGTAVSVQYATAPDTATSPADFAASNGRLDFSGVQTTQQVVVQIVGDTTVEPTERFFVNLSAATGASIADAQAIGTITTDDAAPPPVLSISNASQVSEPANGVVAAFARFTISLDRPSTTPVSVALDLQSGTATAGQDFADQQTTEIVFEPGEQLSQTFDVSILEDTIDEANESFFALLSAPVGATLGDAQGDAVIIDGNNATLRVNSNADSDDGLCSPNPGGCTLREAIIAANIAGGRSQIIFVIPGTGVQTIRPLSPLPTVTARSVDINGYTQPGGSLNTVPASSGEPLDTVITIELDGGLVGAGNGLKLCGAATVRGLAIGGFPLAAILAGCDNIYNPPIRIHGNFIGTAADGITPRANGRGILALPRSDGGAPVLTDAEIDIGGPQPFLRNVIAASRSTQPAVQAIASSRFLAVRIEGNLIGTDRSGVRALGNAGPGIELRHPQRRCPIASRISGNVIAANGGDGVRILNGLLSSVPSSCTPGFAEYNELLRNRIGVGVDQVAVLPNAGAALRVIDIDASQGLSAASISNNIIYGSLFPQLANILQVGGGPAVVIEGLSTRFPIEPNEYRGAALAVDLGANGATPNDPGDIDNGPNTLLNTPVVTSAAVDIVAGEVDIGYTLDTPIVADRQLTVDAYAEDEGGTIRYVGTQSVGVAASGILSLRLSDRLDAGDRVRLGLRALDDGSSELSSNSVTVTGALPQVASNRRRENAGQPLVFTVSLSNAPAQPVSLSYTTADGSANAGSDYTPTTGSIALSAATPSATINVPIINDSLLENPETVLLNVSPTVAGSGIASARGEAVIDDDEALVRDEGQYDTIFLSDLDGRNGTQIVMQPGNWLRVAGRGDFNGDGAPDLAIGSGSSYSPFRGVGSGAGAVHVLTNLSPPFEAQRVVAPAGAPGAVRIRGTSGFDAAGIMLDMVDLRGDGLLDVLIGVPGSGRIAPISTGLERVAGAVSVLNGRAVNLADDGTLGNTPGVDTIAGIAGTSAASVFSRAGYTVSAIGDVNGDGRQDLAVSSPAVGISRNGEVHLVFGRSTTTPLPANLAANVGGAVLVGAVNSALGLDVRGIGDFDNDGIDDLAIVSRTRLYVVRGRVGFAGFNNIDFMPSVILINRPAFTPVANIFNALDGLRQHAALSRGGDIDGDGFDDFVFASTNSAGGARSSAYIVRGSAIASGVFTLPNVGGRQAIEVRSEWLDDSNRGTTADILPDFNGDGLADVVLGASGGDEFGAHSGTAYLIYGRSGLPAVIDLFDRTPGLVRRFEGPALSRAGSEVRAVADFQGDGLGDLAITAPDSGSVYLVFSNNTVFNGSLEARAPARTGVPRFDLGRATAAQLIPIRAANDTAVGRLVATVGDINGDGRIDVLRNANPFFTSGSTAGTPPRPRFTIGFGTNGPLPPDAALDGRNGFALVGATANNFAVAVSGGGDFDGDGRQDLVATLSDGSGALIYGRTTTFGFPATIDTAQVSVGTIRFGFSDNLRTIKQVRLIGDVNGDGRGDLLALSCTGSNGCTATSNDWRIDLVYGRTARAAFAIEGLAAPAARVVLATADGRRTNLLGEVDIGDIGGDTRRDFAIRLANGDDAIVFGSSTLPANIDLGALTGGNGFRITGASRSLNRIGRFTAGTRDDLAIVLPNIGTPGSAGAVQIYRGRAGALAAGINPLTLGPTNLGPRFLGSTAIPLSFLPPAQRNSAVAANVTGDAALDLLIAAPFAEGRGASGGVAVIVPGFGSAWTNTDFVLDYSGALPARIITGEGGVNDNGGVTGLIPLGDLDGDGKPEVATNDEVIIRGSALQ
ncbi:MAG: Calx-beta domain-containing protein [Pseudomonadota bacterium]